MSYGHGPVCGQMICYICGGNELLQAIRLGLGVVAAAFACAAQSFASGVMVNELRCEYRANPIGIDVACPRLSWILESQERGQVQTAYQVLVSSNEEYLAQDKGDLWDSGKVISDQSIQIDYGGPALKSRQCCCWRVRVWDKNGKVSKWSEPAFWTMGLLDKSDWQAKWIGLDGGANPDYLTDAQWIWSAEDSSSGNQSERYFRRKIVIPSDREVGSARLIIATRSAFSIYINGEQIRKGAKTIFTPASEIDVEKYLHSGTNTIAISAMCAENKDEQSGLICALSADLDSGDPMVVRSNAGWKASAQKSDGWEKPDFDDSGWMDAKEFGLNGQAPFDKVLGDDYRRLPARMLRREFDIDRKITRATAYMCGLGLSELYINGKKIGDHVLSPGLTDYNKRALYVTYDVTENLKQGTNAVGVMLGNGRYFAPRKSAPTTTFDYGYPKLLLQMEIEYSDGSTSTVISDGSWKLTTDGPIRANSEYDGEVYDSRKEMSGWSKPGFEDSNWMAVQLVNGPKGVMSSEIAEPIRVMDTVRPIAITSPKPGVYIFDMGQNMVGWCRLKVKGPKGSRVYLRHAEKLCEDGTLYMDNLRSAKVTDTYVLNGNGVEVYEPRFTYHGFRFVEMTGFPGKPDLSAIEGIVIYDSLSRAGEFSCSNPLINQIYHNMYWGMRSNYRSIPTDCPQRDERQGWFGDRAQVSRGEMYVFDTSALQTKWMRDIEDSQLENGSIPDLAPAYWGFYSNSVTFPTLALVIPGHMYGQYADKRMLQTHYSCMKKWIDMMSKTLNDYIMPKDTYGDWCVPPESPEIIWSSDPTRVTNAELVSTAYFYSDLRLIAHFASLLGYESDMKQYSELADKIKVAFNYKFFNKEKDIYDNGTQTSAVLPLAFGLVPEDHRQNVFANLVDNILVKNKCHIGTGMIGGQWLMRVLSDNGRPDVAYKLATQTTFPSWGYMVSKGATTIWELWNGDTGDPLMDSGNHVMQIGDLCTWLHEYIAGIAPDEAKPGFKHIVMKPRVLGDMTSAKAYRNCMHGRISSDWKVKDGAFVWNIDVPANSSATAYIPAKSIDSVTESGKPANSAESVKFIGMENGCAVLELGSGHYSFVSAGFQQ